MAKIRKLSYTVFEFDIVFVSKEISIIVYLYINASFAQIKVCVIYTIAATVSLMLNLNVEYR